MKESPASDRYDDASLTPEEARVILHRGTEAPGTGQYLHHKKSGTYVCRRCGAPLYRSGDKFDAGCGWPSFDDEIAGAVERRPDPDGRRTEILCLHCGAHLGHVFSGERLTPKNTRHCVNSVSLRFLPNVRLATIYVAGGCFWGVEHHFQKLPGVLETEVGYMGGRTSSPTYKDVCSGTTGHAETLRIVYDADKTPDEKILRLFFETHDFTQVDRQGPDIGTQYRSVIFYTTESQKQAAEAMIARLNGVAKERGRGQAATALEKASRFWPGEKEHQRYYEKTGKKPYCHLYRKLPELEPENAPKH